MNANKNSIVKSAFKEAKNKFVIVSLPLSIFALLTIIVLVIGYFAPITLILTLPFIVIPSFFAVSAINTVAVNENTHEFLGFFIMFRTYFAQFFRGGYKVIIGLLKALFVFVVASVIFSAIFSSAILNKDPSYIAFVESVSTMTDTVEIEEALANFISTNETFNFILIIVNAISSFFAFYMFMHHFAVNSFKYNYNFLAKLPLPMQDLNLVSKTVLKSNRKSFYKDYYKAFWFLGLILLVGFAAGFLIAYFFIINIDMVQMCVVGLFGSFVFLLLFVPYFLNASQLIFQNYRTRYIDTLIDLSKKSLEQIKKTQSISPEKEQEVLKILESQKEDDTKIDDNKEDENK